MCSDEDEYDEDSTRCIACDLEALPWSTLCRGCDDRFAGPEGFAAWQNENDSDSDDDSCYF